MIASTATQTNANRLAPPRLAAVIDTAADAIVIIDAQGRIQTFNQAAERMFGYDRVEMLGQSVSLLMPQAQGRRHPLYIADYLKTGDARIIGVGRETVALRKDGTLFPVELAVSEAENANTRTFTGVIRDISERRHLETELVHQSVRQQQRLGFDLHDGLCQELAGIAFAVRSLEERASAGQSLDAASLAGITVLLQDAVRHARELAQGVHPVQSGPHGLAASLQQLVEESTQLLKIPCVFKSVRSALVENATAAVCLYRIAHAAIHMAVSHGKASRVEVRLSRKRNSIVLNITDNREHTSVNGHCGHDILFRIMQYWAKAIGANVHIPPGRSTKGFRLVCELPNSNK